MKLNSENVTNIFLDSLFKEEEIGKDPIIVDGIMSSFAFGADRIHKYQEQISELIKQLPEQFHEDKGGGWSFLNSCNDINGNQWTGEQRVMEQLLVLGIAAGIAKILMPRNMWKIFPGGMPYFSVKI